MNHIPPEIEAMFLTTDPSGGSSFREESTEVKNDEMTKHPK